MTSASTMIACDKLHSYDPNGRYLVVLKKSHTSEDAERIIQIVSAYESSLEYYPNVNQLNGTLSDQALLLVSINGVILYYYLDQYNQLLIQKS